MGKEILGMNKLLPLLALVLIVAVPPAPAARAAPAAPSAPSAQAHCADVKVPLRNLKIEAKWADKTVRVGDTARLKLHVTRTADEDPVTEEPWPTGRPMEEPVEGVELGLALFVGNVYLNGAGFTDAEGGAVIPVRIQSYTRAGTGRTFIYGEKMHTPPDFPSPTCRVQIYEWGALDPGPILKIGR